MELTDALLIAAGLFILLVAVSTLSARIGVAAPLVLLVVGIGLGYIPWIPLIDIDPEIILMAILPLLLYSAAVNVPVIDLKRNIRPIAGLSVLLVLLSALVIGSLLHWVVPVIPFPAAVALGAVVAPTDAVAATSIGKRLGMPPRLVTILEGESLLNDATSLVLLRTAVAAVAGSFVFWEAVALFAYAVAGGIVIGCVVGFVMVWIRSHIANPVYDTVLSFTVPFLAFVPAESVGTSGVLAVVLAGLISGHLGAKRFDAHARSSERMNWRTVQFVLEHGVFLVMGLELRALLTDVNESTVTVGHTGLIALSVVALLIIMRMAFMVPVVSLLANERDGNGIGRRGAAVLGWSGMRGVVTLAAAQSIPTSVPYRSQIVLIAFIVAVVTLLLHGLTLPAMIRAVRPHGPSRDERARELVNLYQDLAAAGHTALDAAIERESHDDSADPPPYSERVIAHARSGVHDAIAPLGFSMPHPTSAKRSPAEQEALAYLRLAREVLESQRAALHEARSAGEYDSVALRLAEETLDAYELRLTPRNAPGSGGG